MMLRACGATHEGGKCHSFTLRAVVDVGSCVCTIPGSNSSRQLLSRFSSLHGYATSCGCDRNMRVYRPAGLS